ncbi:hypothetical protein [Streptomyces halobius]|uniref:IrrE N-terminal-like domain-containing protein n=1 Tax=Streptomyces halobius TaxID=2879846 RepID=A0ABY4M3J4_9ACTN|nr:hypothetical protein [Streptomyces halobius]UQA92295.1 hypothetical protein K9S39_10975 [Streptomyces halobius]
MGERRGRPLYLHALPMQTVMAGAYGLWLGTSVDDHIFYEQQTSRVHREHIVLHEIGHILFDHRTSDTVESWTGQLLPDLDLGLVGRLLGRTNYSTSQEREAEMIASLMRTRMDSAGGPPRQGQRDEVLARLGAGLGLGPSHEA